MQLIRRFAIAQYAPGGTFFDSFSLDVEGAELSVVESIDFGRVGFGVIFLEADEYNKMKNLAAASNFSFHHYASSCRRYGSYQSRILLLDIPAFTFAATTTDALLRYLF